jgi:hypothetical protein
MGGIGRRAAADRRPGSRHVRAGLGTSIRSGLPTGVSITAGTRITHGAFVPVERDAWLPRIRMAGGPATPASTVRKGHDEKHHRGQKSPWTISHPGVATFPPRKSGGAGQA